MSPKNDSMRRLGIGAHHRGHKGYTDDWLTPPELLKALGPFDLDPCACRNQPWPTASTMYTECGLIKPWTGRVWLNPPYGNKTALWLERLAKHGDGIALIFARTETAMFQQHVWGRASGLLFLAGRLNFHHADGKRSDRNAGGPSVLVAYGLRNLKSLRDCGWGGALVSGFKVRA